MWVNFKNGLVYMKFQNVAEGTSSPLAIVVGILVVILFIVAVIFILIAKKKRW